MDYFKRILKNISVTFLSEFENQRVIQATTQLKKDIELRNLNIEASEYYQVTDDKNKYLLLPTDSSVDDSLKKNSPFKTHLDAYIKTVKDTSKPTKQTAATTKNKFFNPQLFCIVEEFFYIVPFWSGIIINMWQANYPKRFEPFTRLSNNPVENWFKILKYQILRDQVKPSQHSSKVYKHLLAKYFEHYKPNDELLKAFQYPDKSKIKKKTFRKHGRVKAQRMEDEKDFINQVI